MNGELAGIFIRIVNMSISGGWVCAAVLVLRLLLQKAPKWSRLLLWGMVGARLLLPVSVESVFSLLPSGETIDTSRYISRPFIHSGITSIDSTANRILGERYFEGVTVPTAQEQGNPVQILAFFWILGMTVMLLYVIFSYVRVKRNMQTAVRIGEEIYESAWAGSPFVFGILRPRIYLPPAVREADRRYILAHEEAHIRHRDHILKPAAFLLLAVYWFHPLIWLAFILFCRDLEFACDERVIRMLPERERADYSQALLACSLPRKKISVCPLAFSENDTKSRIRNVLHYRKPAFWLVLSVLALCLAAAVCILSDPKTDGKGQAGEIILAEADLDDDGIMETIGYQEPDAELFALHITKPDGTELWPEDEFLGLSHVGWAALFLYQDDTGSAILLYSPWAGQGLAAYSYRLYGFEKGSRQVIQNGPVDFQIPEKEEAWPPEALAFAEEVNGILAHSTLLLSTIGGELRTGEDASLWKCGPETASGPLPADEDHLL